MSMTVQNLRDYVRLALDTDEDELPDVLLEPWLVEAQARVRAATDRGDPVQSTWQFLSQANVQAYSPLTYAGTQRVSEVQSVEGPFALYPLPHTSAVAAYASGGNVTGNPVMFSVYNSYLYLWPTPSDAKMYTVRGLRQTALAIGAGDVPDCPEEFHSLIGEYMLARAYEQMDDDIMSAIKFQRFESSLALLAKKVNRAQRSGIRLLGRIKAFHKPDRLLYDFET